MYSNYGPAANVLGPLPEPLSHWATEPPNHSAPLPINWHHAAYLFTTHFQHSTSGGQCPLQKLRVSIHLSAIKVSCIHQIRICISII